jgi:catechol 2,3-dioxygenase-like lactoylglutathione lyase family enzyme
MSQRNPWEEKSMLAKAALVAFVGTARPEDALVFYRDTLGLRLVEQHQFAMVFDAAGTILRVTIVSEVSPHPYTVLGWHVSDIFAARDELAARGVSFVRYPGFDQDERDIWTAPGGTRIAWFRDPDGNLLSLND